MSSIKADADHSDYDYVPSLNSQALKLSITNSGICLE